MKEAKDISLASQRRDADLPFQNNFIPGTKLSGLASKQDQQLMGMYNVFYTCVLEFSLS